MDINTRLKSIIANQLQIDADAIADDTDVIEELSADSLDVVDLLMTIEDKYGIVVPDDEVQNLRTIALMSEYIDKNLD